MSTGNESGGGEIHDGSHPRRTRYRLHYIRYVRTTPSDSFACANKAVVMGRIGIGRVND